MKTSKELLAYNLNTTENTVEYYRNHMIVTPKQALETMIEFAKLHVAEALEEALESIPCLGSSTDIASYEEVKDAVLNAYDLNNIK